MILTHNPHAIPRDWSGWPAARPALLMADIRLSRGSRLAMKLLVFASKAELRRFWRTLNGFDLGRHCVGAVNGLASEVIDFRKGRQGKSRMEVDPRYFCLMGLVRGKIDAEIITHEAIHAGFAYAKRVKHRNMWRAAHDFDEEHICYPAGRIALEVSRVLYRGGMLGRKAK